MMLPFIAPIDFKQNPTDPVVPLPTAPQAKSALGQVMAGAYNGAVKPAVEFMESPVGFGTLGLGALGPLAQRGAAALFAPYAFKNAAEATGHAKDAILDPNASLQDKVTPLADALSQGLMGVGAARHAIPAPDLSKLFVTAWHGTPHEIGPEGFSMDKIGTGEGAQAYGHGLYFAGSPKVAGSYRQTGLPIGTDNPGNVYKVDLPPEHPEFLDWNTPLAEQGIDPQRMAALRKLTKIDPNMAGGELYSRLANLASRWEKDGRVGITDPEGLGDLADYHNVDLSPQDPGGHGWDEQAAIRQAFQQHYDALTPKDWMRVNLFTGFDPQEAASAALAKIGIPGIRYLDAQSRGAGQGTHNYVMFDDKGIKILEKNGQPVSSLFQP